MTTKVDSFRILSMVMALIAALVFMAPANGLTQQIESDQVQGQHTDPDQDINNAMVTLQGVLGRQGVDKIPPEIIQNAQAVAIFPGITRVGLLVGGGYGDGVLMMRDGDEWTGPVFLSLYGASLGAQIGYRQTESVMVFLTQRSLQEIQSGSLEFGADAGLTIGRYNPGNKVNFGDIMEFSESSGGYAGLSLSTGFIEVNTRANNKYFEQEGRTRSYYGEMISGMQQPPVTEKADQLARMLKQYGDTFQRGTPQ